jgi:aspartyl-tRNA(Asn)/glutamyl-tRNA(Gln) amidotransferase subunit A
MDIRTLSAKLQNKEISPVELVNDALNVISEKNPAVNAFITVCEEEALSEAKKAEEEITGGEYRGPLHGIPIGVKDIIFTKDIRTTMGSKVYANFVPEYDATVVKRLKQAGAIIVGKTNTHEFANGPTGDRSYFGAVRNPHHLEKITGGSSSGSGAAVAAKMVPAALGSDTGGSIRVPAACCGVVGMKPTFGRVSKNGVYPLGYTLDHIGPMTQTVYDNALLLNILSGYDNQDPYSISTATEDFINQLESSVKGKKIGIPIQYYFEHVDPQVQKHVQEVIEVYRKMGVEVVEVDQPYTQELIEWQRIVVQCEAYAVHQKTVEIHGQDIDEEVRERLEVSAKVPGYQYVQALQRRQELTDLYNQVFDDVDAIISPTLPMLPTNINQREVMINGVTEGVRNSVLRFNSPTDFTGNPSMSIPCGFSASGLPVGYQLIGKHLEEAKLYQLGHAYETRLK